MSKFPDYRIDHNWISSRRGEKAPVDPFVPYGFFREAEHIRSGHVEEFHTILLTNRECPFRCLMCDLWKHTLNRTVPPGALPAQISHALDSLPEARHIKLYNSGSFFDPGAIPPSD